MQTPLALQKNISIASLMKSIRLFVVLSQTKKCIITIYCKPFLKKKLLCLQLLKKLAMKCRYMQKSTLCDVEAYAFYINFVC